MGPKTSPLGPGETVTVTAHGTNGECTGTSTIPTDALSLSLNVTAVDPTSNTFLTFWGDGPNPGTSNLNPAPAAPTPNSVNTPISPTGTFNIFNNRGDVNVIVDVNGYYANHNHDDRYLRPLETYVVPPQSFTGNDPAGDSWSVSDVLEHSPSASRVRLRHHRPPRRHRHQRRIAPLCRKRIRCHRRGHCRCVVGSRPDDGNRALPQDHR